MDSDNDSKIRNISRLLELGGTMLAEHCNTCGAPMFRYHGKVVCPVCEPGKEMQPPQPAAAAPPVHGPEVTGPVSAEPIVPTPPAISDETALLEDMVLKKMTGIAQLMQDENDTRRVMEQLELIERGLDIIERLRKIA